MTGSAWTTGSSSSAAASVTGPGPSVAESNGAVCEPIRTKAGDPPSRPSNSPSCHCRARNQAGSRTRAARPSATDGYRALGCSWFQYVIEGIS